MTEQEFDKQVWRRFDVVTTDTGIETTIMNVCFTTRSVRIYVKNAPPEWLPCKRIEKHTTRKGDSANEGTIIEELHNKLLAAEDRIVGLKNERQQLADKIGKNYLGELLRAVNIMQTGLQERKKRNERIERCLSDISAVIDKLNNGGE
jgi:hypothetical protein